MPSPHASSVPQPQAAIRPAGVLALAIAALAAMLLLNAPAMLKSADLLPFESPARAPALRLLPPAAKVSSTLRADRLRSAAQSLERRFLEPARPAIPESAAPSDVDEDDDSALDDFLDL